MNANSVPTLTISSSLPASKKRGGHGDHDADEDGDPHRGAALAGLGASLRGNRPSRDIAKSTRVWPSSSTMTTVVRPASAPMEMTFAAQSTPWRENAVASVLRASGSASVASSV